MTQEQALNRVIDCWQFAPGLNKKSFSPTKICELPKKIKILCYTDTSILFSYNGKKIHGRYDWVINGWEFE